MSYSADTIAKVLKDIQSKIPKSLLKQAVYEEPLTPTVKKVMLEFLRTTKDEVRKKKVQELMDSGEFDKKHVVDNPKIQKLINNFVSREINKAIKQGRLPPRSKIQDVDFIREMYKKVQEK